MFMESWILRVSCKVNVNPYANVYEPRHEISNNVVCATSNGSDQPAHTRSLIRAFARTRSLIRAFARRLNIIWLLSYWLNNIWSF